MKLAQKNRPAVVSAVEPLESRALFSASPVGDSPTEHAVQTVTLQNPVLSAGGESLNYTKICYRLLNQADY